MLPRLTVFKPLTKTVPPRAPDAPAATIEPRVTALWVAVTKIDPAKLFAPEAPAFKLVFEPLTPLEPADASDMPPAPPPTDDTSSEVVPRKVIPPAAPVASKPTLPPVAEPERALAVILALFATFIDVPATNSKEPAAEPVPSASAARVLFNVIEPVVAVKVAVPPKPL